MSGEPDGEIEGFYSRLGEEASQKLTDWQQKFQAEYPQTLVNKTILVGKRAQEILGFCQEKEIDLIVMTSRTFNVDGNNKEISGVGTLSHKIALFSPVSVLVVR